MKLRFCLAAAAVVLACGASAARAQDEGGQSFASRLNYCLSGGAMTGVGPQGSSLGRGPYGAFNINGENAIGLELGVEAAYASSNDAQGQTFTSLSGIARLSPFPEDYRAYVQLGAGGYYVSYDPKDPATAKPSSRFRPGGSFGVGVEMFEGSNFTIGGIVTYDGVVVGSSAGRSYLVAAINLTFRPTRY